MTAAQSGLDAAQRAWQKALTSVSASTGTSGSRSASGSKVTTGSRSATGGSSTSHQGTSGSSSSRLGGTSGTSTRSSQRLLVGGVCGSSTGSAAATAARIASDQASVTQAELTLGKAEANLADATLTAPIPGVVAAVGLTPGTASGGSISLIGSGGATVTVEVPATSIARVVAGEQVDVTPPGALVPVAGTVQQVSLLPAQSSTTSSVTTYPVVIAVAQPTPTLAAGSRASASILLGTADGVVTVPNSAITTTSRDHRRRHPGERQHHHPHPGDPWRHRGHPHADRQGRQGRPAGSPG